MKVGLSLKKFEMFLLIVNLTCSKLDTNKKCLCMFKKSQTLSVDKCFFKYLFFYQLYLLFLLKIEEDFNKLMIKTAKRLELMKIIFITHFSKFDSKMFLTLKIIIF
jgi:hypothetical protein